MSVTVKLRLPVPEGKSGDVVEVSDERAAALVDRRYATYVSGGSAAPEPEATADAAEDEPAAPGDSAPGPVTELPAVGDAKAEWVAAADALGIDTEGLTKAEVVEAVQAATA